jgi:hypothetical protein
MLESRMRGNRARTVWRRAVRKRACKATRQPPILRGPGRGHPALWCPRSAGDGRWGHLLHYIGWFLYVNPFGQINPTTHYGLIVAAMPLAVSCLDSNHGKCLLRSNVSGRCLRLQLFTVPIAKSTSHEHHTQPGVPHQDGRHTHTVSHR